ncbi:MAG TPA: DUF6252 family protein [Rhodothermales bacterium]
MRFVRPVFVLALIVALAACDSSGDGGPNDPEPQEIEGSMTAEVSGRAFEADSIVQAHMVGSTLVVEGADSTGRMIRISLLNAARGTYDIGGPTSAQAQASYSNTLEEYEAIADTAGTLALTRLDSLAARGTFEFIAETVGGTRIIISSGEFLAPWSDAP